MKIRAWRGARPPAGAAPARLATTARPARVVVVVPAHNEEGVIEGALRSVERQTRVPDRLIVMCDNCSDETAAVAERLGWEVWRSKGNRHKKAGALNQAWERLESELRDDDFLVVMDADSHLDERFLEEALAKHADDGYGGVGMRETRHKKGRVMVLTGTATAFRAEALRAFVAATPAGVGVGGRLMSARARRALQAFAPLVAAPVQALAPLVAAPATAGPGGATVSPRRFPRLAPKPRTVRSVAALSRRQRVAYWALTALWLVVVVQFWSWWLAPEHRGALGLFLAASIPIAYLTTVLPSFYWFFVGRMRRPVHMDPPAGRRVALITLCVPSHETLDVIAEQLEALTRVRYPHDSWVLDEGADPDVEALAAELGVRYFTRKGKPLWNQTGPPFQAKTKAGNVNAWLDYIEMEGIEYDVFVQLDIDHCPMPEYLHRTLGYLDDPDVAWVQAPSVCANLERWTARGLAEQDLVLQGPLQMGFYGHSQTPFIIGSHTTYRTAAIRAIGGFQPTRAEDHLDTVVLAAHGYRGVFVPEVIAAGQGPADFGTYLGQQFAWAYSMVQIFLGHTPRLVRRYTRAQAFQFLMAQSWYTLWSLSLAVLWVLPIVALLARKPIANVALSQYLVYNLALILASTLMWRWSRRWFQPAGVGLTWRGVLLEIARWPIVLWAFVNALLRVKRPYMITPKGDRAEKPPPASRLYGPPIFLAGLAIAAVGVFHVAIATAPTQGYLALVLFNAAMVVTLLVATLALEVGDLRRRSGRLSAALRLRAASTLLVLATVCAMAGAVLVAWAPMMVAVR